MFLMGGWGEEKTAAMDVACFQERLGPASEGPRGARQDPVKGGLLFPFQLAFSFHSFAPCPGLSHRMQQCPNLHCAAASGQPPLLKFLQRLSVPSSVGVGSLLGLGQGGQLLLLMRGGGGKLQGAQGAFGDNVVISSANAAHSALVGVIWGWSEDCC